MDALIISQPLVLILIGGIYVLNGSMVKLLNNDIREELLQKMNTLRRDACWSLNRLDAWSIVHDLMSKQDLSKNSNYSPTDSNSSSESEQKQSTKQATSGSSPTLWTGTVNILDNSPHPRATHENNLL